MKRVMCVWLPQWPLQRLLASQPEHRNRAVVLFTDMGRRGLRVVDCSREARQRGITLGMPLAEAKGALGATTGASSSLAAFIAHNPEADNDALHALANWCQRFSPIVGVEGPDSLLLDLTGCAHLFGGEHRLTERADRSLKRWGLSTRMAVADTIGAAWGIAHFGDASVTVVPPGGQIDAMSPLPISALRLPEKVLATLDELCLNRIEQLLELPRTSLPSRFGPDLCRRLDQATGELVEQIEPLRPPEPLETRTEFEEPTADRRALETVLRQSIEQLIARAVARQLGVQQLNLQLTDVSRGVTAIPIGMLRPCRSAEHLWELVRTRLEQTVLTAEVREVYLLAATTTQRDAFQGQLFESDDHAREERELAQFIDRVSHRLGEDRVVQPVLQPEPQPELAVRWQPLLPSQSQTTSAPTTWSAAARPLRLHAEPIRIEVTSIFPDGPPLRFFLQNQLHTVARHWGPERIETGWWRERHIRRDYFRVETKEGRRFWLFRRSGQRDWFLQGEFD